MLHVFTDYLTYNGGQKNLGLCENSLPSNYWSVKWVHPVVPPPSSTLPTLTHSHFHPWCWQFNFVWGGWGGSLVLLISLETGSNTFDHCCAYFCIQLLQIWLLSQPQSYFGVIAAKIHKKSFLRENNINNIPLFTLGKHNLRVKKPSWLGANQELVWTNPASSQGETWTQCLWIASPVL